MYLTPLAGLLLLSLFTLLTPARVGVHVFETLASPLVVLILLRLLASYIVTSLCGVITIPPLLPALGFLVYDNPPRALLGFLMQLGTAGVVGSVAKKVQAREESSRYFVTLSCI